jgi:cell division protein FtsW (lipid II flippase)
LTLFSTLAFLRTPLTRGLARTLAIAGEALAACRRRLGAPLLHGIGIAAAALAVAVFAVALVNLRQLTSELGRIWIILGAAWFFYLRAGPLADRLARDGGTVGSLVRYALPLAFVVGVLLAAMVATRDLGPLLIAGYGAGAFVAATLATWAHRRGLAAGWASAFGIAVFAAWIGAVTAALFALGSVDPTTAARLESIAAPFTAANDQQALVAWFREATPAGGFGLGHVPWCGWSAGPRCGGVPAQVHSDYTFTALVGVFGWTAAWATALGAALWMHRLVRHHARVTTGEPRLASRGDMGESRSARGPARGAAGGLALDGQALASWIALAWVVLSLCQLAVTVAGNLGVLPLTGVTFPFTSFGLTSNAVNLAFLAMAIQVTVPEEGDGG